ncbi:MAG: macro domain-containing protein [Ignavibacteriales bacterium]
MRWGSTEITLKIGDITLEDTEAIVNAANSGLLGGGGVDGAIHRAGGPAILEECRKIRARQGGCPTGEAVITTGGRLKAKYVVHTVGPVWRGRERGHGPAGEHEFAGGHEPAHEHAESRPEDGLLRNAYRNSLRVAKENGAKTIAFPSISTGAYRFPIERAARIALETVRDYALEHDHFSEVRFVLFTKADYDIYMTTLQSL